MATVEGVHAALRQIIESVEQHGPAAQARTEAFTQAVARFEELTSGSDKWQVQDARSTLAEVAEYVFYAEGKSELVRYAIESVINAL